MRRKTDGKELIHIRMYTENEARVRLFLAESFAFFEGEEKLFFEDFVFLVRW